MKNSQEGAKNEFRNVRFLDYFGYLLDSTNEEEMNMLRDEYSKLVSKIKDV